MPDNRHTIALPYWARPNISSAVESITAGKDDDDPDDDDDDDDDDDPDDDKDEETLRAELKALRKSLESSNKGGKRQRERRKALQAELDKRSKAPTPKADDEDDDAKTELDRDKLIEQGRAEGAKDGADKVKRASVRAALAVAGVASEGALKMLANSIDLDELDLNDDDTLDGIDAAIEALKTDTPELFAPKRRKRESVAGGGDKGDDDSGGSKTKSTSERQAAGLRGRG